MEAARQTVRSLNASPELDRQQRAEARARAYAVLARVLVRGIGPDELPALAAFEIDLGDTDLAQPDLAQPDLDGLAAGHQRAFFFEVFPYESAFLDPQALVGGSIADELRALYARAGFTPKLRDVSPDHVGIELAALAMLSGAEADAWRDDHGEAVARVRRLQAELLDAHLLRWLVPLVAAVVDLGLEPWAGLITVTAELLAHHRAELDVPISAATIALPGSPLDLDDPETRLRDVAEHLLTPVRSGLLLTRHDLQMAGRAHDLPRGFGSRRLQLESLLEQAGHYDQAPELIDTLAGVLTRRLERYRTLAGDPTLAPFAAPWLDRLEHTRDALTRAFR